MKHMVRFLVGVELGFGVCLLVGNTDGGMLFGMFGLGGAWFWDFGRGDGEMGCKSM